MRQFSILLALLLTGTTTCHSLAPVNPYCPPSATADPSTVICGCVSATSGDYFEVNTDMTTHSVEPISLNRVHVSSEEFDQTRGCWRLWPGSIEVMERFWGDGKNR